LIVYNTTTYQISSDAGASWTTKTFPITIANLLGSASFNKGIGALISDFNGGVGWNPERSPTKMYTNDYMDDTSWRVPTTEGMTIAGLSFNAQKKEFILTRAKAYDN